VTSRRAALAACVTALLSVAGPALAQTDFPARRVHMIVPYPAGGIVDIFTRAVTDRLSGLWRQPIVVEAMPGANGNLAWGQAARAEPDGYTWTSITPALLANPYMYANLRWSEKSFVPVSIVVWAPSVLVVHPGVPASTVTEFIDYAGKHLGALNWAKPGTGTSQHLNMAIFLNATRLDIVGVPYSGQPPGILDLIANRVQFMLASIGLVAQHVNSGALKALAVLGTMRSPLLPDVPTMSEAGYPAINVVPWYGFAVPRATPAPVTGKIVAGFNTVLKDRKLAEALERQALQPVQPMSASEVAALYATDTERYVKVIRSAGITLSDSAR
jgi:tripartite-type tricarboxylate transporter receptor subunit TctC